MVKMLGYGNGTTHRLLKNLINAGLVIQDPLSKGYFLSSDVFRLAARIENSLFHVKMAALHEMEHLRDETKETVVLCKRVGLRKVIVEEITSPHGIKFEYGKGYSSQLHSGATGIALLTHLDEKNFHLIMEKSPPKADTKNTIVDVGQILAHVKAAIRDGYSISFGEVTEGTAAVSVPLMDGSNSFALTVVGPAARFYPQAAAETVKAAARSIEARISPSFSVSDTGHAQDSP